MIDVTSWFTADEGGPPRVCVIAEVGVNHDGSLQRALELVQAAAEAGADAVKLQCFCPDRLLSNQAALAGYQQGLADDARQLLRPLTLEPKAMAAVRKAAREAGLAFIVTPFSVANVAELAELGVDAVKIASPDAVNLPLLAAAVELGVPMLVSTGASELAELEPAAEVVRASRAGGCLMHCVSSYPTPMEQAALAGIGVLVERFGLPGGYSDHTQSTWTGALAVAAGAVVLEKHLTYNRAAAGPDHAASLDPASFKDYVQSARQAAVMLGPRTKTVLPIEQDVRQVSRQSLCATRDLPAGHVLTLADLTIKRPGTGVPAAQLQATLGRRLARPVRANNLLQVTDLS